MADARTVLVAAASLALLASGCLSTPASVQKGGTTATLSAAISGIVPVRVQALMNFTSSIVTPAVSYAQDLYEPTMEVSDTGALYVAAHVAGAASTGTPAYVSTDGGKTWTQLPFVSSVSSPIQGAAPPPGDEGVIVAGEKGQAWMADIYAYGFSITGWCDNGKTQCYDDREAYDRMQSTTTQCKYADFGTTALSLNDRPWAAYASGTIVLINNAGGGAMQIGAMKVPPPQPVGVMGVNGPTWNLCASRGGGIPTSIAMRADGLFAGTQAYGDNSKDTVMDVTIGNAKDISKTTTVAAFPFTSAGSGTIDGASAFDKAGTLFVAARNNTLDKPGQRGFPLLGGGSAETVKDGRFIVAASTDDGKTFKNATFSVGPAVQTIMLDSNPWGDGVLLVWSQATATAGKSDWYVAHAFVTADGTPTLKDVTLALAGGPRYYGDVMGAALGPDGRAYFVTMDESKATPGGTPLAVEIQKDGPRLPTAAVG